MRSATGLSDLASAAVSHCNGAQAVALTFPTGFKVSYSGDCRPSKWFTEIGKGSTVLIHEATFEDELRGDAKAKKHSTVSEAIGVGIAMGARRVILTHFSQRYQKIPVMDGIGSQYLELEEPNPDDDKEAAAGLSIESSPHAEDLSRSISEDTVDAHGNPKTNVPEQDVTMERQEVSASNLQNDIKIAVAFDFMRVKVKDIFLLEKLAPAFIKLYEDSETSRGATKRKQDTVSNKGKKQKNRNLKEEGEQRAGGAEVENKTVRNQMMEG